MNCPKCKKSDEVVTRDDGSKYCLDCGERVAPDPLDAASCSPSTLRIKLEGREYTVPRKAYAIKKTAQLREFGYTSLTVDELEEQIDALLADKKLGDGLTVIGMFMEGEVLSKANKEAH